MATDCARVCACVRVVNCMKSSLARNACSVVRLQYTYWKHLRKEGFPCKPTCTHRPATGNGRGRPRRPGPAARRGCSAEAPWQKCSTRPPATVPDPPLSTLASARRPSPPAPPQGFAPARPQFSSPRAGGARNGRGGAGRRRAKVPWGRGGCCRGTVCPGRVVGGRVATPPARACGVFCRLDRELRRLARGANRRPPWPRAGWGAGAARGRARAGPSSTARGSTARGSTRCRCAAHGCATGAASASAPAPVVVVLLAARHVGGPGAIVRKGGLARAHGSLQFLAFQEDVAPRERLNEGRRVAPGREVASCDVRIYLGNELRTRLGEIQRNPEGPHLMAKAVVLVGNPRSSLRQGPQNVEVAVGNLRAPPGTAGPRAQGKGVPARDERGRGGGAAPPSCRAKPRGRP